MMKQKIEASWLRRLGFGLTLVVGLLMVPGVSYAHLVEMLSSLPENGAIVAEAPEVITAVFNEEMQTDTSTFAVFNAEGQQVDNGDGGADLNDPEHASMLVSVPPLSLGVYTVRWHVVLLDGDATAGAFNFFVGDEQAASAANFVPIPDGSEVETTAVPSAGANSNTIWLVAGILVSALVIGGAFFLIQRRNKSA
jgi:LPXTG-motif cell wall-anchored protein